jgi:hypothetical protein
MGRAPEARQGKQKMIAARDRSSPARIAARLIAGVCALALAPAVAQQTAPPPAPRAAPSKPKTPTAKPESAKAGRANGAPPKPAPAAPSSATKPAPSPAPSPAPAQPRALPALPPLDTSVPPPLLPRASRERMRACADEWNVMKRKSISGLPTWRDFATGCLTRAAAPRAQEQQGSAPP